jgi:integrase/recombinase XerD
MDFNNGIITVRHGKGDKKREVPFLGEIEKYLSPWKTASAGRVYVFCAIRKGDHFGNDKPMNTKNIYEILRETGDSIGIEFLAPHDMRRSLITNALNAGASLSDMQFVAGHSQPATTLRYAKVKSAQDVKGRLKDNLGF